jgi:hypothetical protein
MAGAVLAKEREMALPYLSSGAGILTDGAGTTYADCAVHVGMPRATKIADELAHRCNLYPQLVADLRDALKAAKEGQEMAVHIHYWTKTLERCDRE